MRWYVACDVLQATMIEFNPKQRTLVADKLFDAANVAAGGMIFGQFVAARPFSTTLAMAGLIVWIAFVSISVGLQGRNRR